MQTSTHPIFSVDRWLPAQLASIDDRWQAVQARVFVVLLLLFFIPIVPSVFILVSLTLGGHQQLLTLTLSTTFVMLAVAGCFAWFQHSGNLKICAAIYGVLALVMTLIVIYHTGGWESPVSIYTLTLPVLFSMISDIRTSTVYAVLVLLVYLLLFLIGQSSFEFIQLASARIIETAHVFLWAGTLATIIAILALYDYSEENLSKALAHDRHQLDRDANCDALTGLLNEQALIEKIQQYAEGDNRQHALIYLAVKNLTGIVNQFGFEAADRFMQAVSALIHYRTPARYLLARHSNNGFIIYIDTVESQKQLHGILDNITDLSGMAIDLADGSRFRLILETGVSVSSGKTLSPQEMIDEARESITYASPAVTVS